MKHSHTWLYHIGQNEINVCLRCGKTEKQKSKLYKIKVFFKRLFNIC